MNEAEQGAGASDRVIAVSVGDPGDGAGRLLENKQESLASCGALSLYVLEAHVKYKTAPWGVLGNVVNFRRVTQGDQAGQEVGNRL